jgi:uncharacterized membrane protein (DUF4010 family)
MTALLVFAGAIAAIVLLIAAPWYFARRDGRRGARNATIAAVVAVIALPVVFVSGCEQYGCGQGIIAITFLLPIALITAAFVGISGYLAVRSLPHPPDSNR